MAKAFVLIVNESGKEDSIISNLRNVPSISNAYGTFGTYDLIVKLQAEDLSGIAAIVVENIRQIEGVTDTKTLAGADL